MRSPRACAWRRNATSAASARSCRMPCRSIRASISTSPRPSRRSVFSSNGASAGGAGVFGFGAAAALRRRGLRALRLRLLAASARSAAARPRPRGFAALRLRSGFTVCAQPIPELAIRLRQPPRHSVAAPSAGTSAIIVAAWRTRPAREPAAVAGAEEDVAARRPDDRRAGVLRDHQAAEGVAVALGIGKLRRLDEDRRVKRVERAVDGEAAERRQRHAGGAERPVVLGELPSRGRR